MIDLAGQTVIITGASKGIGAETAAVFAAAGAKTVLAARSAESLSENVAKIEAEGGQAMGVPCDVSNYASVRNLFDQTQAAFGTPNILINNAGILDPVERLEEANIEDWERVIDINVKGVFYGIKLALPLMVANGGGTIITVGSGAATSALEGWSAYCTSKAAVHHLNSCLHTENAQDGIRAMIMSPGTVATDMQRVIKDSGVNPVSQIPWENHVPPEWIAKLLHWMCGPEANPYLGQTVALRGDELKRTIGV